MTEYTRPALLSGLLAFTAGYVDTVGFIALFGLFTAHVTGNFVLIGATMASGGAGIIAKLLALPTFVIAVALARLFVLHREQRGSGGAVVLLGAQAVLLGAFLAVGLAAAPVLQADEPVAVAAGVAGVAAMGVQNAASRTVFAGLSPTTVMTGNVTQVVIDLVDLARGASEPATRARLGKIWPPVAAFAAGAIAGAFGYAFFSFWCLTAPIGAVLLTAAATSHRAAPSSRGA